LFARLAANSRSACRWSALRVRLGHEVTLFASGDSTTSAKLVPACALALWRDVECREPLPRHVLQMELVFRSESRRARGAGAETAQSSPLPGCSR
jgi:hypothetical protein